MIEEPIAQEPESQAIVGPRRSYVLAVILTLLAAGLGHVYAGRARRGFLLHILGYLGGTGLIAMMIYFPVEHANVVVCFATLALFYLVCLVDAVLITRKNRAGRRHGYQRWWVYLLLYLCALIVPYLYRVVIVNTWVEAYVVPTGGMSDTVMAGDRILAEKQRLIKRPIRHGDVLIINRNSQWGDILIVQRVIGLPGDVIEFKDEQLFRNGMVVDEPYLRIDEGVSIFRPEMQNFGPITISDGELFMVGDNRRLSDDSRTSGNTAIRDVVGHVMTIYFSSVPPAPEMYGLESNTVTLRAYGIDEDNPPGKIRWDRIGKRIINSD